MSVVNFVSLGNQVASIRLRHPEGFESEWIVDLYPVANTTGVVSDLLDDKVFDTGRVHLGTILWEGQGGREIEFSPETIYRYVRQYGDRVS